MVGGHHGLESLEFSLITAAEFRIWRRDLIALDRGGGAGRTRSARDLLGIRRLAKGPAPRKTLNESSAAAFKSSRFASSQLNQLQSPCRSLSPPMTTFPHHFARIGPIPEAMLLRAKMVGRSAT